MGYRYETHCHSREGSACSILAARDLVRLYAEKGYAGMALTDHFSGNSPFEDAISWRGRVEKFREIHAQAEAEGSRLGIKVFPGIEYSLVREPGRMRRVTGNDFLIFGLGWDWWLEHEDILTGNHGEDLRNMRAAGGFIVHAHPFLEADWVECIRLLPRCVDAVEVQNGCQPQEVNGRAAWYARSYGLAETAGSDTHSEAGHAFCGLETDEPCDTIRDLIEAIKTRRAKIFSRD